MLKSTFQHIAGFSENREKELWKHNIFTWEEYEKKYCSQLNLFDYDNPIRMSISKLIDLDFSYFTERIPRHINYRLANTFPEKTIFLDIETTGLSHYYDDITMIGWSIGNKFSYYISGQTDKLNELRADLSNAACIVTFNGSIFDLPFIRKKISDVTFPKCHIDLRFFSKRLGFAGGQKEIEKKFNVERPNDLIEIDGSEAVILWHRYKEGDVESLKKLIRYNAYDIWGMKNILETLCYKLIETDNLPFQKNEVYPFSQLNPEIKYANKVIEVPVYKKKAQKIVLSDLGNTTKFRVIGIDLTGSEEKATGWAYIENGKAVTRRILTNKELIEASIELKPHVISIDSPLSLPKGRISPFDDDPGRYQYGILRECERMLKKRGINSYPCLINSMQKLTERGIMLANEFRKLGFAVIESYPGAAQDIMGIPRKSKSLEFLVKGLQSFGITGDFDGPDISHDELDAVTSAVVGYFFMADKYEAMGNDDENYLIIPNLGNSPKAKLKKVIGISGSLASGKTTAGKLLEKKGFTYSRYSLVLKNHLETEGKEVNRKNLQEFGDYVNKFKGQRWLGQQLVKQFYNPETTEYLVVDGLRFLEDPAFLRETFGDNFLHIHIQTADNLRKERYLSIVENNVSFDAANSHEVERETELLMNKADIVIDNNGSLEDFEKKLFTLIQ